VFTKLTRWRMSARSVHNGGIRRFFCFAAVEMISVFSNIAESGSFDSDVDSEEEEDLEM
jgi:hypothetical protein